uniref:Uncharacterized protein n=1 Tax=Zea mays TaxID=4577 RepID=B4FII1_MAIZE|nr:unknown [Zea mays]
MRARGAGALLAPRRDGGRGPLAGVPVASTTSISLASASAMSRGGSCFCSELLIWRQSSVDC